MKGESQILQDFKLRETTSRSAILRMFLRKPFALSYTDIETEVESVFDRVTVYRTLQTFVEKGIIHQIPTTDNSIFYALESWQTLTSRAARTYTANCYTQWLFPSC